MRLYKAEPAHIIRITITKQNYVGAQYINLCDTTLEKAMLFVKKVIEEQKISPFEKGKVTSINFRDCIGSKNGKSQSLSFKGLSVDETYELIMSKFKNK